MWRYGQRHSTPAISGIGGWEWSDHTQHTKRGRKRFFNEAIHALRMRVERTFAWEDKFKRLLLRFERIQQRHYGMKLMAYTLINLRAFCGV
jgi:transposase